MFLKPLSPCPLPEKLARQRGNHDLFLPFPLCEIDSDPDWRVPEALQRRGAEASPCYNVDAKGAQPGRDESCCLQ